MRFSPSWRWPVPFGAGRLFVGCFDYLGFDLFLILETNERCERCLCCTPFEISQLSQSTDLWFKGFFFLRWYYTWIILNQLKDHYRLGAPRDGSVILGVSFPYLHGLKASYKNLADQRGAGADYKCFSQENAMHFKRYFKTYGWYFCELLW